MDNEAPNLDLIESLSEIPFRYKNRQDALKRIAEIGHQAMGSFACTLVFLDQTQKEMTQRACVSSNKEFERYMDNLKFSLGQGAVVDIDLISKGHVIEKLNLQADGQGVANPEIALRFGLGALLGLPLFSNGRLLGYLNTILTEPRPFTVPEKRLMEVLAKQVVMAIERFDFEQARERATVLLNELSQDLLSGSSVDVLQATCDKACELLSVPVCVAWRRDTLQNSFYVVAATQTVDPEYRELRLDLSDPRISHHLSRKEVSWLSNVSAAPDSYVHSAAARQRGWASLLSAPMWAEEELVGILDVYTKEPREFALWEKLLLGYFANQAAICLLRTQSLKKDEFGKKIEKLLGVMVEMAEVTEPEKVWELLLQGSLELVNADRGWIRQFNYRTGLLEVITERGNPSDNRPARKIGEGITGWAFKQEAPARANNVREEQWKNIYLEYMPDTASELAIPILVRNAQVRVADKVEFGTKPIGVLNIESPALDAFSKTDENWLWSLACHAAIVVDNLKYDQKLGRLRQVNKQVAKERDPKKIIQMVLRAIEETLGFEHINLSVIVPERGVIKSEYVVGLSPRQTDEFKKEVENPLNSDDIQADIVRTKKIEVPEKNDKRFNQKVYRKYGHDKLNRVFVPMILSATNRVIGTVETGYQREYRKYIYERDVQILRQFVEHLAQAIEQEKATLLIDQVTHELKSPIVGIRGHADLMRMGWGRLSNDMIDAKFEDILSDCEIMLYQVGLLEYRLGGKRQPSRPKMTNVFRDIIIKTIQQVVRPALRRKGIPLNKVEYNPGDSAKIIILVDSVKLNQVVYNLLNNALKYAKSDPVNFKLSIEIDVNRFRDNFVIKFKDWGIGIEKGYDELIFEEGVRTPEAIKMDVNGSGIGLTIARRIMREFGGDLKLVNHREPTEFHMILPRRPIGGE